MAQEYSKNLSSAAYILPVGWIVAYLMRKVAGDDTEFTTFHLRQGLGLSIFEVLCYLLLVKLVDSVVLNSLITIIVFFLIVTGLRGVQKGLMRYQPLLGRHFDRWFAFIN